MTKELEEQIKILEKFDIKDYSIENDTIIIKGSLNLSSIKKGHKDFLKNTVINGYLYLNSVTEVDKDFLKYTTIKASLYLNSVTEVDKDFLKYTTIKGNLYLDSLKYIHKDTYKKFKNRIFIDNSFLVIDDISYKILKYNLGS